MKWHLAVLALAFSTVDLPEAHAGDPTIAEALFRDGRALMQAGDYASACPKLNESYRQDPASGTLLALGLCYERTGKLASAWTTYSLLAARAHEQGQLDRERAGRERGAALTPRLSKLSIEVPEKVAKRRGLRVRRDGQPLASAAWGVPLPLDGGEHVIEVDADGRKPFRSVLVLAGESDLQVVHVPDLEALALPPPAAARPSPVATDAPKARVNPLKIAGLVTGGMGVIAFGVGAAFGLQAKSSNDSSNDGGHCTENVCDPSGIEHRNEAFDRARTSTILFVSGALLTASGVTLYVLGRRASSNSARLQVLPVAAGDGGGFWLRGEL